jgi:predicted lipoprotein with Yx(FWY)xxD motif
VLLFVLAWFTLGCGGDSEPERGGQSDEAVAATNTGAAVDEARPRRRGTKVILAGSPFGRMLYNADKQAIYIFQRDRRNRSNCYGECARAWPPVFTKGAPRAGKGVRRSLLGTVKRRDGRRQVTYAGKPLYYYVNEGPNEVKCHNVNLNGGLWWVVGPDGKRRA